MKNILSTIIILGITFTSCTITKRKYLSGYSVDFKKSFQTETTRNSDNVIVFDNKKTEIDSAENTEISNVKLSVSVSELIMDSLKPPSEICDTIILVNGEVIIGKIKYVDKKVNYQKCNDTHGIYKSKSIQVVSKIKYGDGRTKEYQNQWEDIEKKKKTDKKVWIGLFLIIPGFIIFLFGFLQATFEYGISMLLPFIVTLFALGLIAIIIGIRSIHRVSHNRKTYYMASIFLGVLSIITGLLLISFGFIILLY